MGKGAFILFTHGMPKSPRAMAGVVSGRCPDAQDNKAPRTSEKEIGTLGRSLCDGLLAVHTIHAAVVDKKKGRGCPTSLGRKRHRGGDGRSDCRGVHVAIEPSDSMRQIAPGASMRRRRRWLSNSNISFLVSPELARSSHVGRRDET